MSSRVLQAGILLVVLLLAGCGGSPIVSEGQTTSFVGVKEYSFGETAVVGDKLEVTLAGIQFHSRNPTSGDACVWASVKVKNVGGRPESDDPVNPAMIDGNGHQYNSFTWASIKSRPKIYPGVQTEHFVMFDGVNTSAGDVKIYLPFDSTTIVYNARLPEVFKKINVTITNVNSSSVGSHNEIDYDFTYQNIGNWPVELRFNALLFTNNTLIKNASIGPKTFMLNPGESENYSLSFYPTFERVQKPSTRYLVVKSATYTLTIQAIEQGNPTILSEATKTLDVGELLTP